MKTNTLILSLGEYFTSYLPDVKGLSRNSIRTYQYAFQLLFEFMNAKKGLPPEKVSFASLTNKIVMEYLSWLESERNCSIETRNFRRAALSSFAKFAIKKGDGEALAFYSQISEVPRKKAPQNNYVKYFTKEEISILLSTPNEKTIIGRRDIVLMSVLYASGARAQELCNLTVNDIYFGNETNIRLFGKGSKARLVTLPENCAILLKKYLEIRHLDYNSPQDRLRSIFCSQTHEKMSVSCIEEIVKKHLIAAKKKHPLLFQHGKYSPHSFRHSIAVHMLECGESLVVIKAFLGHASITSTTIYASVTPELANKYLRERGRPLESTASVIEDNTNPIITALPFLNTKRT